MDEKLWSRMKTWTRQELVAVACPYCNVIAAILVLAIYSTQQDLTALLYAALPESLKSPAWFICLLLPEANLLFYTAFGVTLVLQLHVLFPLKLTRIMQGIETFIDRNDLSLAELHWAVGQVRTVQLLVTLFNAGHRNVIQCFKLLCIGVATVNGYASIAHSGENLIYGFMSSCVTCNTIFLYAFVYEKAFAIPTGLQNLKGKLKMSLVRRYGRNLSITKAMEMQINSIPAIGLRVGDFHLMERVSTPVFMDYVVRNVVNLLVLLRSATEYR